MFPKELMSLALVISGDSSVPTVLGPASEFCLAFVGGHDQSEAIVCVKAGFLESPVRQLPHPVTAV